MDNSDLIQILTSLSKFPNKLLKDTCNFTGVKYVGIGAVVTC